MIASDKGAEPTRYINELPCNGVLLSLAAQTELYERVAVYACAVSVMYARIICQRNALGVSIETDFTPICLLCLYVVVRGTNEHLTSLE